MPGPESRLAVLVCIALAGFGSLIAKSQKGPAAAPSAPDRPPVSMESSGTAEAMHRERFGESPLSQSLTFGDGGRVRFLLRALPIRSGRVTLGLQLDNEGGLRFTLGKADRWTVVTSDGRSIPFEGSKKGLRIDPLESETFVLAGVLPEGASISKIVYASAAGGLRAELAEAFQPAILEESVPVPYDAESGPTTHGEVGYAVLVDADGVVQRVAERSRSSGSGGKILAAAAADTMARWKFRGAMQGGRPVPSLSLHSLSVGSPLVLRAVVDSPVAEVRGAVEKYLGKTAKRTVNLPGPGGVLAAIPMYDRDGWRRAQALLVRTAEETPGRTRITVAASSMLQVDEEPCECSLWATEETGEARKAMTALLIDLKSSASLTALASPNVRNGEIPSGFLERAGAARIQTEPVARLLRATLARPTRGAAPLPVPAPEEYTTPPPAGAEPGPIAVADEVVPPSLLEKMPPVYPEAARKAKITGRVVLQAVIGEDGRVKQMEVLEGPSALIGAAARALACWRYKPATLHGKPIPVYYTVAIAFSLG